MSDVFALRTGSLRSVVELIEPLIEVRFRKVTIKELNLPWLLAISKDQREYLALFPNDAGDGRNIDIAVDGYELFLYLVRSPREEKITRTLATETRFRFVRPANRIMEFADGMLQPESRPE